MVLSLLGLPEYFHKLRFFSAATWCQAVGSVYSGLQVLSERSSMITRALDYIGDMMKHIKPLLVSKNQEGLQLVYWAVGQCRAHFIQKHLMELLNFLFFIFFFNTMFQK